MAKNFRGATFLPHPVVVDINIMKETVVVNYLNISSQIHKNVFKLLCCNHFTWQRYSLLL